ncbi:hypothetical protein [Parafrankia sp. EUN1f]|uniref:hypothetical protein n=1 Tax=Parafrankia sp. EUN1f TaxID=102897 RepID=UPI0001C4599A|nr:hypothetical protein [Parafrankia sp. EUN1f]EFC86481.1 hypothetical protein FrEUN1fDRAFT_0376 [Parafrankia sp. EUN1f]
MLYVVVERDNERPVEHFLPPSSVEGLTLRAIAEATLEQHSACCVTILNEGRDSIYEIKRHAPKATARMSVSKFSFTK